MKFYLIPVGQQFEYKQKHYIKSGPLTASPVDGGKDQLIPRSAETFPSGSGTPHAMTKQDESIPCSEALALLTSLQHYCASLLDELDIDSSSQRLRLEQHFQEITSSLMK